MASEEVEVLSDHASERSSELNSEETSETEVIGETESSSTPSGKFRSDMWKCTNGKKALCQLCNKEYAYYGTTSNLRDHLQRYH